MVIGSAVYLDHNAGAPLHPKVREELAKLLGTTADLPFANPSSVHTLGRKSKSVLSKARKSIAASLGISAPESIVFTSSGSEANQMAICAVLADGPRDGRNLWLLSPIEHDSTLEMRERWTRAGGIVEWLDVTPQGEITLSPKHLELLKSNQVLLVSTVWVNNETGVINPVSEFAEIIRSSGTIYHIDGAQAWGKLPIQADKIGADYLTFSGHKIGAFPGVGVLWKRPGATFLSPLIPGKQEMGRRGGTENLWGVWSLGIAAENVNPALLETKLRPLQEAFEKELIARFPQIKIHGRGARRVPNTTNFYIPGLSSTLVMALDLEGYCVSAGSACSSGAAKPSHVLVAMGNDPVAASSSVRVSTGSESSIQNLMGLLAILDGKRNSGRTQQ